jgi:hypothetical protein
MQAHTRIRLAHDDAGRHRLRPLGGARELRIGMWGLKAGASLPRAEVWLGNEYVL